MDVETVTAKPRSPVSCVATARGIELIQDKPEDMGGTDEGMMASEILMASLLACQLSTFAKVAAKRRIDASVESIRADAHFDDAGDIGRIAVTWGLQGVDDKQAETLIRLTDKVCTISRALKVPIDVDYSVSASPAANASST